jgi:O-antigen ligase
MAVSSLSPSRRHVPPPAWLAAPRGVVRVALAPLAWLLAAVDTAVRRPSLVTAAMVLLVCLPSEPQDVSSTGHVTAADLAAVVLVGVIAVRMIAGDRATVGAGWLPFAMALVAFAVATVTAQDVGVSPVGFVRYAELFVLVPVAVAMTIRDRRDVLLVAGAIVATTVYEGSLGVWQYFTQTGAAYAGSFVRAVGTFGAFQVLALGALVGYGAIVTIGLGLTLRGRPRVLLLITGALLMVPLVVSLSRGAWIATACSLLLMLALYNWRLAAATVWAATLAMAVAMAVPSTSRSTTSQPTISERLTSIVSTTSEPDRSVRDRYGLWQTAVAIWADHPVVGVGMKNFSEFRDSHAPLSLSSGSDVADPSIGFRREPLLSAHNMYLMVLSEQGLIGFGAFLALFGTLAVSSLRRRPQVQPMAEGRFFDLVAPAIMVWTLIDFMYGDIGAGPTGILLATVLGLVARRSLVIPRPVVVGPAAPGLTAVPQ